MIALLIDADNFSSPAWIDEAVQTIEKKEGVIAIRRAYGSAENLRGLADILRIRSIRPFVNLPLPKNTTDMSLAVDAMELACLTPRPKLMVIASGDLDFVPLVVRLRERGVKVVCVTERGKMALDAVPAYDQVIYVSENPDASSVEEKPASITVAVATPRAAPKKAVTKKPAVKITSPKLVAPKKAPVKKVNKKTPDTSTKDVSHITITTAIPSLKDGNWRHISEVAKMLHDKKILAKNATSTKLFRKFPEHFELMPTVKPNQVRYIK